MYLNHFKFRKFPFSISTDLDFYLELPTYKEALNVLVIGLMQREGIIKITGEVGIGKTLLCRKLTEALNSIFYCIYLPNPKYTRIEILREVARHLGLSIENAPSADTLNALIIQKLKQCYYQRQKVVLVVDEAQCMDVEGLETIRLLTNFEENSEKLLQVILFGQLELNELLAQNSLKQLVQRIVYAYQLRPLKKKELATYLNFRVHQVKLDQSKVFHRSFIHALYKVSGGIPRVVNILAHKALMAAFGENAQQVTVHHLQLAIEDSPWLIKKSIWPFKLMSWI